MLMLFMKSPGPKPGHCDSGFQSIEMRERKREKGDEGGAGGGARLGLLPASPPDPSPPLLHLNSSESCEARGRPRTRLRGTLLAPGPEKGTWQGESSR